MTLSQAYVIGILPLVAIAVVLFPLPTFGGVLGLMLFVLLLSIFRSLSGFAIFMIGVLLMGYTFLGRGFAYMGIPPLYIGEFVLILVLLTLLVSRNWLRPLVSPITWVLLAFMLWGMLRTLPYIAEYGLDALRDSAIYAYGLYALAISGLLLRKGNLDFVSKWYSKWSPWFVLWVPISIMIYRLHGEILPKWPWGPGGGVPVINPKYGDFGVHLVGVMAFLVLGLHRAYCRGLFCKVGEWVLWGVWGTAVLVLGTLNRGSFVTVLIGMFFALFLHFSRRWLKPVVIASVVLFGLYIVGVEVDLGGPRKVSYEQIALNIESILGNTDVSYLESSKQWRLNWWKKILGYTIYGDYFWLGKGFGINLATDDGFQNADESLRSPHNSHLMILARMGVPGFVLWLVLQFLFAFSLFVAFIKARSVNQSHLARLYLWVLIYWFAFMVNANFDVFLESPQGGVWFWSLFGYGLALLISRHRSHRMRVATASAGTGDWGIEEKRGRGT